MPYYGNYFGLAAAIIDEDAIAAAVWSYSGTRQINSVSGTVSADVVAISGDAAAADALEAILDGTRAKLYLTGLDIVAAGNDAAIVATGSGSGAGIALGGGATGQGARISAGLNGPQAIFIRAENGHGMYISAGRVGLNLSGNEIDDGSSAIDIYNQGWTNADTIRIDNGVALGSALQIRGYGAEPVVKIQALGTNDAVEVTASAGTGIVVSGAGVGNYDIDADTHGSMDGDIGGKVLGGGSGVFVGDGAQVALVGGGLTAQETANAVHNLAPVGAPAAGSIGSSLDSILNGLTGVGLIPLVYTVTELDGITPIDGVAVELYTEEACLNCVRRGMTNSFGVITFWLTTAGTYWIKNAKDGYSFELDSETVAA